MLELQQELIVRNGQWAINNTQLTERDWSLFKLACDLKDAATKMQDEEEGRILDVEARLPMSAEQGHLQ